LGFAPLNPTYNLVVLIPDRLITSRRLGKFFLPNNWLQRSVTLGFALLNPTYNMGDINSRSWASEVCFTFATAPNNH